MICRDKDNFNKKEAIRKLEENQRTDIYDIFREWPYKDVVHRILAEVLIKTKEGESKDLSDYKFFCFDGEPRLCQVIRDRNTQETIDFYDMDWNHQEFVGLLPPSNTADSISNGLTSVARPKNLDKMAEICRTLSKGIPFLRVDLYVIEEKVYFGEMTFFPASGIGTFHPKEWNATLGDFLKLPLN